MERTNNFHIFTKRNETDVQVYVSCKTYNQASYITDAMNGFCIQKTDFPYVCAIFDDCSTDGEQVVIREYMHDHFDMDDASVVRSEETDDYVLTFAKHKINPSCFFLVLFLKYNHYSKSKAKDPYVSEWINQAKYIALCEGDDYWTDPHKLQKQVDYMEAHPDCGLVHAYTNSYHQKHNALSETQLTGELDSSYNDILWANPITTLSVLYRKEFTDGYLSFIQGQSWRVGDLPLWLYISLRGKVHKQNFVCGVYRIVENSESHGSTYEKRKNYINTIYDVVCFYAEKCGCEGFNKLEQRHYVELFNEAFFFKKKKDALKAYSFIKNYNAKILIKRILLCFKH